jgi:creatinine amidohydrolase
MRVAVVLFILYVAGLTATAQAAPLSVYLEELTWTEVRDALQGGTTTIIVPVGGTEQNGPHMALGKHNARAKALAGRIANTLGDTLVAPVLSYVPEGNISPPDGHMRYPGTISIPDAAFKGVLEGAGRSFRQAGFAHIVLIGDSGNYQGLLKDVANQLNRAWAGASVRAHFIADYYRATQTAYVQALRAQGLSDATIGTHAGLADTSLLMALARSLVRADQLGSAPAGSATGVAGDPRGSTTALGQLGVDLIVAETVAAIRKARLERH